MDDPGGQKWRPDFYKIFEEGRDYPPELVADFVLQIVSGKADRLSGRYLLPHRGLREVIERADEIVARDRLTLRIRE